MQKKIVLFYIYIYYYYYYYYFHFIPFNLALESYECSTLDSKSFI